MKPLALICIGLVATAFLVLVYAFWVEPYWIEITRHQVSARMRLLKIAHLTDLHITKIGMRERKVIRVLREESPDLILITGDLFSGRDETPAVRDFLRQLIAPLGVWMVDGNWDHWTFQEGGLRNLAANSDVVLLRNQNKRISEGLWLVGLDDAFAGTPEIEPSFSALPKNALCIAVFHSPELFSKIEGRCSLNLAGHTHGGQIRLPGLGPLWLPPGSGKYVAGWYGAEDSKMYVSRGVGTSILGARLFSRPEIAIFMMGDGK